MSSTRARSRSRSQARPVGLSGWPVQKTPAAVLGRKSWRQPRTWRLQTSVRSSFKDRGPAIFAVGRLDQVRDGHRRVAALDGVQRQDLAERLPDQPDQLGRAGADDHAIDGDAVSLGQPLGQQGTARLGVAIDPVERLAGRGRAPPEAGRAG